MSLFEYKKIVNKKTTLEYVVNMEDVPYDEFHRLKKWIQGNIPSSDRYTPDWNDHTEKMEFRFRYEEHAMAFKLIIQY